MTNALNAECPTCKTPLPVVLGKQSTVRVAVCKKCGDEYEYSAWVLFTRNGSKFHQVDLEKTASGHHVRPLTEGAR